MIPLLPFVAGLVVGAAALSALRSERTRKTLNETGTRLRSAAHTAEEGVRSAARSGLTLLHGASAAEKPAREKPAAKRTAKKAAAGKSAAPKRAPRKAKTPEAGA